MDGGTSARRPLSVDECAQVGAGGLWETLAVPPLLMERGQRGVMKKAVISSRRFVEGAHSQNSTVEAPEPAP